MKALVLACALVAAPLCLSCGGGGGGASGVVLDAFRGTYHWSQHIGDAGPPLRGTGLWGNVTSDGSGMITTGTTSTVSNGGLNGPTSVTPFAYEMPGGGRLHWLSSGVPFAEGGVSSNGEHAVLGAVNAGGDPSIALFTRKASGMSNASLSGTYHFAQFVTTATGGGDGVLWGIATFDGAGGVTFSLLANLDGVVTGPTPIAAAYTVAGDGTLAFGLNTQTYVGGVRQDGQVAFFSGGIGAGDAAGTGLFIKHATAVTNATFVGNYHYVQITASRVAAPAINWTSVTGTLTVDGAGGFAVSNATQLLDNGTTGSPITGPGSYSTAANGAMTVYSSEAGAVSADGSVAAFVGGTTTPSDLRLYVLIR